jgi:hypothetical protein
MHKMAIEALKYKLVLSGCFSCILWLFSNSPPNDFSGWDATS